MVNTRDLYQTVQSSIKRATSSVNTESIPIDFWHHFRAKCSCLFNHSVFCQFLRMCKNRLECAKNINPKKKSVALLNYHGINGIIFSSASRCGNANKINSIQVLYNDVKF